MNRVIVAPILNLPYRRFGIGRASASSTLFGSADTSQNSILRYVGDNHRHLVDALAFQEIGLDTN